MTDLSATLAPNSDQLDAVDLRGKPPQVFTVTKVDVKKQKNADQPVSIHLAEFPRVWRPGKNMRRVLAYCWGNDSAGWVDGLHQVELYCDDCVMFAGQAIGGTRVSRLSHIDGPKSVPLITGQGKSGIWKVEPLPELSRVDQLRAEWGTADPERRKQIEAEVASLNPSPAPDIPGSEPAAPSPAEQASAGEDQPAEAELVPEGGGE